MATRLIIPALVFTLVVCPYTCNVGCCADGEQHSYCEAEPDSECCSQCDEESPAERAPFQPGRDRKSSAECNCLCAGAIKQNVDVSSSTIETLRIAVCRPTAVPRLVVRDAHGIDESTAGDGCVRSGSALRTAISSLLC